MTVYGGEKKKTNSTRAYLYDTVKFRDQLDVDKLA